MPPRVEVGLSAGKGHLDSGSKVLFPKFDCQCKKRVRIYSNVEGNILSFESAVLLTEPLTSFSPKIAD